MTEMLTPLPSPPPCFPADGGRKFNNATDVTDFSPSQLFSSRALAYRRNKELIAIAQHRVNLGC